MLWNSSNKNEEKIYFVIKPSEHLLFGAHPRKNHTSTMAKGLVHPGNLSDLSIQVFNSWTGHFTSKQGSRRWSANEMLQACKTSAVDRAWFWWNLSTFCKSNCLIISYLCSDGFWCIHHCQESRTWTSKFMRDKSTIYVPQLRLRMKTFD